MLLLFQVLHLPLEAKLTGLVQSAKGWIFNMDLQFPKASWGQPQRREHVFFAIVLQFCYNFLMLAEVNPKEVSKIWLQLQASNPKEISTHFGCGIYTLYFQKIHKVLRDHYPKQDSNKVMQVSLDVKDTKRYLNSFLPQQGHIPLHGSTPPV